MGTKREQAVQESTMPPLPADPGSYILQDGRWVPNPADDAMMARTAQPSRE